MKRLPKIGAGYWILMILATTLGEIAGNLISRNFGLGYSSGSVLLITLYFIAISLIIFSGKEHHFSYWLLIILGNIAGTNIADFVTIAPLNLGTIKGSLLIMAILIVILLIWRWISPNTSIEKKMDRSTLLLYWLAILMSSTFGTTSGDFLSNDTSLGSFGGSLLLLSILLIIFLLVIYTKISRELCYWMALVIMHPIGATIGNYISKPAGLNFGNIWTSLVLILLFTLIYFIPYFSKVKKREISK